MTSSYTWFNPRLREITSPSKKLSDLPEKTDPVPENSDLSDFDGFEFRLEDPVTMLPADELFSDGKLVPLQMTVKCNERVNEGETATSSGNVMVVNDTCPDTPCGRRMRGENHDVFSPRAPRCSSRWKELLGFGIGNNNNKRATPLASSNANGAARSIRQLLQRNSKASSIDASVNVPLLDNEGVTISSRASLSSSSSSSNHSLDDLPRLSLDSDKPSKSIRPKTRMVKTRPDPRAAARGNRNTTRRSADACESRAAGTTITIDSPRMNSSGKIVFQHLERSSSSPSSFNGGPRYKHRGVMERSYSANVRITNVPVCSLRGSSSKSVFGFPIFSQQKQQQQRGGGGEELNVIALCEPIVQRKYKLSTMLNDLVFGGQGFSTALYSARVGLSKYGSVGVEQDQLTDLTTYVEGVVLGVTPDRWYWTLDGSG
ncbi:hypothetical protein Tco_1254414 [Tanacetum coccineum]